MSAPVEEGGQDYDDILGFPGDGFKDKDDTNCNGDSLTLCVCVPCIHSFIRVFNIVSKSGLSILGLFGNIRR
jgi:hypothetical protein